MSFRMALGAELAAVAAAFFAVGLAAGCGGNAIGSSVDGGAQGPSGRDSAVATDAGNGSDTSGGNGACIDLEVEPPDIACEADTECTLIRAGEICNGQCSCGDTPVNTTAADRYQSETASLTLVACPCAFPGESRCVAGQCILCGIGPNQLTTCPNAVTTPIDDGGILPVDGGKVDARSSPADANTCVDIALSTYDQSCNQASDCIVIQTGEVCSGQCACGGDPVNVAEQSRYEEATSGIRQASCPCPSGAAIACVDSRCTRLIAPILGVP